MQRKTYFSLVLALTAAVGLWNGGALATAEEPQPEAEDFSLADDGQDEELPPLVLSTDGEEEETAEEPKAEPQEAEEPETIPPQAVVKEDPKFPYEEVPLDAPELVLPEGQELTEEQMRELSNQPLFKEFTNAIGDVAPMPGEIDVESLDVPGAKLVMPGETVVVDPQIPEISLEEANSALDEVLEIANCDLDALCVEEKDRATIAQLDAEIQRLCPLWIGAELNRATVGRRELNWRQPGAALYSTTDPKPVDAQGSDWAMAVAGPYFFQVLDSETGEPFYTKAGDFEQIDPMNLASAALVRDGRTYLLTLEPGKVVPTGRAERIRVKEDGQVQGTDAAGRLVTDVNLANIPLFLFDNPARLQSADGVLFTPTPFSGEPRQVKLLPGSKGVLMPGKVMLSNGKPEEIFARISTLCKSKKRLVEILSQPRLQ